MFRKGLDKNGGRKHTGSKQAQHNCALFPCQEYNRIFFKGVFRPFLYGLGYAFFVLPDKQYNFFLIEFTA